MPEPRNHFAPASKNTRRSMAAARCKRDQPPPFICGNLPNFVELRGGNYFFLRSITALGMIAMGLVAPR